MRAISAGWPGINPSDNPDSDTTIELGSVVLRKRLQLAKQPARDVEKDSIFDLEWGHGIKYRDLHLHTEIQCSRFNFEEANVELLKKVRPSPPLLGS